MSEIIIEVDHLSLERDGRQVLRDVSLTVKQGEVLVIIGQSGSGKSSLLRCLNRLEVFQSGKIHFKGEDIANLSVIELRQQIGMVFQKGAVFEGSVADNIAYGPRLQQKALSTEKIIELMQQVSLEADLIDRNARDLSGGQEQRLAIARTLANQPAVLLLDEPTSALDPIATHKVEATLCNLCQKNNLTLIWVSHSIEQARRIADRVIFLEDGQVVRVDTVEAMLDEQNGDPQVLAFARGLEEV